MAQWALESVALALPYVFSKTSQFLENFLVCWESVCFVLAVDQLAVDFHIEDSALALDQFGVNALR
jgi:hypothetical protein